MSTYLEQYEKAIINDLEVKELCEVLDNRNASPKFCAEKTRILEEKLSSLNSKLPDFQGQFISAISRGYDESLICPPPKQIPYYIKETLYLGIITPKTKIEARDDLISFANEIYQSCYLELGKEENFRKEANKEFVIKTDFYSYNDAFFFLYFMERPPKLPKNADLFTEAFSRLKAAKNFKRLEFFIGDEQSLPVLQKNLTGWQYQQASKLLQKTLPISREIREKICQEQFELYNKIILVESKLKKITENNKTSAKFNDAFLIEDAQHELKTLISTAVKRGYHKEGINFTKKLDEGVFTRFYLKKFFLHRKAKYNL